MPIVGQVHARQRAHVKGRQRNELSIGCDQSKEQADGARTRITQVFRFLA